MSHLGIDRAGLESLYLEMEGKLYNIVYRYVWDPSEAQDLVHEAFVKVWQRRLELDPQRVGSYLFKTAINLAAKQRRKRRVWSWVGLHKIAQHQSPAPSPHAKLEEARDQQRLQLALDQLSEKLRRTLLLCDFAELSYKEVASLLGIAEGTVASRRNAAIKALKGALNTPELEP